MTISTIPFLLAQSNQGGGIASLLILILPMGALVYMMTIPQKKQRQKQADMLRKVEVGDEVVTTGGIVGTITFVEDDLFHLEVDDDVVIRIAKSAIGKNLSTIEATPPAKSRKGLLEGALGGGTKTSDDSAEDSTSDGPIVSKRVRGGRDGKAKNA